MGMGRDNTEIIITGYPLQNPQSNQTEKEKSVISIGSIKADINKEIKTWNDLDNSLYELRKRSILKQYNFRNKKRFFIGTNNIHYYGVQFLDQDELFMQILIGLHKKVSSYLEQLREFASKLDKEIEKHRSYYRNKSNAKNFKEDRANIKRQLPYVGLMIKRMGIIHYKVAGLKLSENMLLLNKYYEVQDDFTAVTKLIEKIYFESGINHGTQQTQQKFHELSNLLLFTTQELIDHYNKFFRKIKFSSLKNNIYKGIVEHNLQDIARAMFTKRKEHMPYKNRQNVYQKIRKHGNFKVYVGKFSDYYFGKLEEYIQDQIKDCEGKLFAGGGYKRYLFNLQLEIKNSKFCQGKRDDNQKIHKSRLKLIDQFNKDLNLLRIFKFRGVDGGIYKFVKILTQDQYNIDQAKQEISDRIREYGNERTALQNEIGKIKKPVKKSNEHIKRSEVKNVFDGFYNFITFRWSKLFNKRKVEIHNQNNPKLTTINLKNDPRIISKQKRIKEIEQSIVKLNALKNIFNQINLVNNSEEQEIRFIENEFNKKYMQDFICQFKSKNNNFNFIELDGEKTLAEQLKSECKKDADNFDGELRTINLSKSLDAKVVKQFSLKLDNAMYYFSKYIDFPWFKHHKQRAKINLLRKLIAGDISIFKKLKNGQYVLKNKSLRKDTQVQNFIPLIANFHLEQLKFGDSTKKLNLFSSLSSNSKSQKLQKLEKECEILFTSEEQYPVFSNPYKEYSPVSQQLQRIMPQNFPQNRLEYFVGENKKVQMVFLEDIWNLWKVVNVSKQQNKFQNCQKYVSTYLQKYNGSTSHYGIVIAFLRSLEIIQQDQIQAWIEKRCQSVFFRNNSVFSAYDVAFLTGKLEGKKIIEPISHSSREFEFNLLNQQVKKFLEEKKYFGREQLSQIWNNLVPYMDKENKKLYKKHTVNPSNELREYKNKKLTFIAKIKLFFLKLKQNNRSKRVNWLQKRVKQVNSIINAYKKHLQDPVLVDANVKYNKKVPIFNMIENIENDKSNIYIKQANLFLEELTKVKTEIETSLKKYNSNVVIKKNSKLLQVLTNIEHKLINRCALITMRQVKEVCNKSKFLHHNEYKNNQESKKGGFSWYKISNFVAQNNSILQQKVLSSADFQKYFSDQIHLMLKEDLRGIIKLNKPEVIQILVNNFSLCRCDYYLLDLINIVKTCFQQDDQQQAITGIQRHKNLPISFPACFAKSHQTIFGNDLEFFDIIIDTVILVLQHHFDGRIKNLQISQVESIFNFLEQKSYKYQNDTFANKYQEKFEKMARLYVKFYIKQRNIAKLLEMVDKKSVLTIIREKHNGSNIEKEYINIGSRSVCANCIIDELKVINFLKSPSNNKYDISVEQLEKLYLCSNQDKKQAIVTACIQGINACLNNEELLRANYLNTALKFFKKLRDLNENKNKLSTVYSQEKLKKDFVAIATKCTTKIMDKVKTFDNFIPSDKNASKLQMQRMLRCINKYIYIARVFCNPEDVGLINIFKIDIRNYLINKYGAKANNERTIFIGKYTQLECIFEKDESTQSIMKTKIKKGDVNAYQIFKHKLRNGKEKLAKMYIVQKMLQPLRKQLGLKLVQLNIIRNMQEYSKIVNDDRKFLSYLKELLNYLQLDITKIPDKDKLINVIAVCTNTLNSSTESEKKQYIDVQIKIINDKEINHIKRIRENIKTNKIRISDCQVQQGIDRCKERYVKERKNYFKNSNDDLILCRKLKYMILLAKSKVNHFSEISELFGQLSVVYREAHANQDYPYFCKLFKDKYGHITSIQQEQIISNKIYENLCSKLDILLQGYQQKNVLYNKQLSHLEKIVSNKFNLFVLSKENKENLCSKINELVNKSEIFTSVHSDKNFGKLLESISDLQTVISNGVEKTANIVKLLLQLDTKIYKYWRMLIVQGKLFDILDQFKSNPSNKINVFAKLQFPKDMRLSQDLFKKIVEVVGFLEGFVMNQRECINLQALKKLKQLVTLYDKQQRNCVISKQLLVSRYQGIKNCNQKFIQSNLENNKKIKGPMKLTKSMQSILFNFSTINNKKVKKSLVNNFVQVSQDTYQNYQVTKLTLPKEKRIKRNKMVDNNICKLKQHLKDLNKDVVYQKNQLNLKFEVIKKLISDIVVYGETRHLLAVYGESWKFGRGVERYKKKFINTINKFSQNVVTFIKGDCPFDDSSNDESSEDFLKFINKEIASLKVHKNITKKLLKEMECKINKEAQKYCGKKVEYNGWNKLDLISLWQGFEKCIKNCRSFRNILRSIAKKEKSFVYKKDVNLVSMYMKNLLTDKVFARDWWTLFFIGYENYKWNLLGKDNQFLQTEKKRIQIQVIKLQNVMKKTDKSQDKKLQKLSQRILRLQKEKLNLFANFQKVERFNKQDRLDYINLIKDMLNYLQKKEPGEFARVKSQLNTVIVSLRQNAHGYIYSSAFLIKEAFSQIFADILGGTSNSINIKRMENNDKRLNKIGNIAQSVMHFSLL